MSSTPPRARQRADAGDARQARRFWRIKVHHPFSPQNPRSRRCPLHFGRDWSQLVLSPPARRFQISGARPARRSSSTRSARFRPNAQKTVPSPGPLTRKRIPEFENPNPVSTLAIRANGITTGGPSLFRKPRGETEIASGRSSRMARGHEKFIPPERTPAMAPYRIPPTNRCLAPARCALSCPSLGRSLTVTCCYTPCRRNSL